MLPPSSLRPSLLALRHARGISHRVRTLPDNVFAEFSALAARHGAVNLGQGFPSFQTPQFVKQAAIDAITDGNNQYTRPGGHVSYVETLAEMYSPLLGRELDPMTEIVSFNGAQEGIASIMAALLEPGDEVLTLEPYFDAYMTVSQLHGVSASGVPFRFNPAKRAAFLSEESHVAERFTSHDFQLDLEALEAKLTPKTKMLVLNTPHNPTGKVLSRDELKKLAAVLERHPHVIVLADEVYEFMTYDGLPHERIAALPGFFDRTISLFSAGKTFSCTGWRTGYAVGPAHLVGGVTKAHSTVPFCGTTPFEVALASAFREAKHNGYYDELKATLQVRSTPLTYLLLVYN
jgi:aspartate/methionine/tyrosine aminotransferase